MSVCLSPCSWSNYSLNVFFFPPFLFLSVTVNFCLFISVPFCFCTFLFVSFCFRHFMSVSIRFCPFLYVPVRFSPFLSVYISFCPFLSFFCVYFYPFMSVFVSLYPTALSGIYLLLFAMQQVLRWKYGWSILGHKIIQKNYPLIFLKYF